jgi:predicted transcriptional regulator
MLVDNSSISVISVHSKNKSANTKNSPSTSVPESPQLKDSNSRDFQSYDDYWTSECEGVKVRNLSKTIQDMDKNQDEMEKKFQQCIEHMLAEIERNNENNSRLAVEVNRLKTEVMESKKDILVI